MKLRYNNVLLGLFFVAATTVVAQDGEGSGSVAEAIEAGEKCRNGEMRCLDRDTMQVCKKGKFGAVECSDTYICKELGGGKANCVPDPNASPSDKPVKNVG